MKFIICLLCLTGCSGNAVFSQTCSCSNLLNELVAKTESDYAGYIHKVKEKDSSEYLRLKKLSIESAGNTSFADCYYVLEDYVRFFKDGHLFIVEFPPKQPDSLISHVKRLPIAKDDSSVLKAQRSGDPIEGGWYAAGQLRMAIIKTGDNTFSGVILQSMAPGWERGMVKMEITKSAGNGYNIIYYRNDFQKIHFTEVHIDKNVFLSFGVYRFAKSYPGNPETRYVDPVDPQLPIIKIIDRENVLLTIPSALIERHYLDSLLEKYDKEIKSTPNLIIDVRGNGGGNYIWGSVYDIANTIAKPVLKEKKEDDFQLLASPDDADYFYNQGAYYRQIKDSSGIQYYEDFVNKIRRNTGRIIGGSWYNPSPDTAARKVYAFPRQVAILIDKGVASAGEAFIMGIRETSSKIILYGDNTYGMIDYMNVNTIPLRCSDDEWYYFGYPTVFSNDIKTKPINPTGIAPDIYIPKTVTDVVQWVIGDLRKKRGLKL